MQTQFSVDGSNVQKQDQKQIDHEELQDQLTFVETYDEALEVALQFIDDHRENKEVLFVSHPISPTTERSMEEQLRELQIVIQRYEEKGYFVFNQIPFHDSNLENLKERDVNEKFEKFFAPLLTSGKFDVIVFANRWEESSGCQREYEMIKDLDMRRILLKDDH